MRHIPPVPCLMIGCLLALVLAPGLATPASAQQATADPVGASTSDGQRFEMAFLGGGGVGTVKDPERASTNIAEAIVRLAFNLPAVGGGRRGSTFGIMIEVVPFFTIDQEPRATGAGLNLMFRYQYAGERWRPMIVFGAGILKTNEEVPPGEVTRNYTPQGGVGLQYMFRPRFGLDIEYRFHHLSNNSQTETNPGIDSHLALLGLVWTF